MESNASPRIYILQYWFFVSLFNSF
jgi:hypothetical protein